MAFPDIRDINRPARLFYSYSHKDENYQVEFENQLRSLRNQGWVEDWHDRKIVPGQNWAREIDKHLFSSDLILLLISVNFISSDYCWQIEMKQALGLHERGLATVIPVIVHPCEMRSAPFQSIQGLPPGLRPISTWENRDSAWAEVAKGICDVISKTPGFWKTDPESEDISATSFVDKEESYQRRGLLGTVRVEISIDRDFDEFSTEDKRRIQRAVTEFLRLDHNVEIFKTIRGSVKIVLELRSDEAEKLEMAVVCGLLASHGIVEVRNLGPVSKSAQLMGRVIKWSDGIKERISCWARNPFGKVSTSGLKPSMAGRVLLTTALVSAIGIGTALVSENKSSNTRNAPDMEFTWTAPTTGTPVQHYVVEVVVNERDTLVYDPVPSESIMLPVIYGNKYQFRVAGVDANGLRGPFSDWSEPYIPEMEPPGF